MTISNTTFDTATGGLSTLIREFSADRFQQQVDQTVKILSSGALKKEQANGSEIRPYLIGGTHSAVTWIGDYDNRPKGDSLRPVKGRVLPANIHATLSMGAVAQLARLGDEGMSELFDINLQNVAEASALHLGKGLYGRSISPAASATWTGTGTNDTVSVTFADISMFHENQTVEFKDASLNGGNGYVYTVRVTSVTPGAVGTFGASGAGSNAVAGTVSFINDVPNASGNVVALGATAVATGDTFYVRGVYGGFGADGTSTAGDAINSFDSVCGTATFMDVDPTSHGWWKGTSVALSAAYNQEAVIRQMMALQQYSGSMPTHVVMSPQLAAAHVVATGTAGVAFNNIATARVDQRTLAVDAKADKFSMLAKGYDSGLSIAGKPIIVDPCAPADQVLFHNSQYAKLAVWKELGADEEAGDPVLLNRSTFSVDVFYTGSLNLYVTKRKAFAKLTSILAL
jgi:hypothetical protein